jgi:mono/diheme cytochrome c family protein
MGGWKWVILAAAAFEPYAATAGQPEAAANVSRPIAGPYEQQVRPFLARHCLECHGGTEPEGGLRLDRLSSDFADAESRRHWLDVLERIGKGEMPPEGEPRPAEADIQALTGWIRARVQAAVAAERETEGRVVLRRLNRVEYENTLSDLLGVRLNLKDRLPQDGSADGFDNAAAALHTSGFLLEEYLEAADIALDLAIANLPRPPLDQKRLDCRDQHQVRVTSEKVFRKLDDGVVFFSSSQWQSVVMSQFYPRDSGLYRFRIAASGYQSDGKPITYRVTINGKRLTGKDGLVGYFDAPPDEPAVVEFTRHMEPRTTISILPYGLASSQAVNKIGADDYDGPGLKVDWVEVEGPLYDSWPPESHRRIFGEMKQAPAPIYNQSRRVEVVSDRPLIDAERILREFTRRAFRRGVTDADVRPFVEVVEQRLASGSSFEQAVRAALKGVLMSPEFLFLTEEPGRLDDFDLAGRLSYFLWSTMPDEELLTLAEAGKLGQPDVLRAQVERMLRDPRAAAFTENFVGQWLGLREIDFTEPSHILYPEFDHMLKVSMIREVELFFAELLRDDLSLMNFVSSDFTMLNGRLAKHYGIAGPAGWEFRKTPLPAGCHRGGVLTMAGVLKVTANGTTTSPVIRGAWVLDRILGTPPSPPPDDVPVLEPDVRGATTIREQLALHRSVDRCATCHKHIDPPGFALESFDCIGGWRDHYRVTGAGQSVVIDGRRMSYHKGKPVDPADVTADGERFEDIDGFKELLLRDKDQIARALTVKLLTYATGGKPTAADQPQVDAIVEEIRDHDYGLRSLVHAVVQSELFRTK